jgi:hypothetical protein
MIMFKQFCLLLTWSLFVGLLRAQPAGTSEDALLRGKASTFLSLPLAHPPGLKPPVLSIDVASLVEFYVA